MSSEQLLEQYLFGSLLTNQLSLIEFEEVVRRGRNSSNITSTEIQEWYTRYQIKDKDMIKDIKKELSLFLQKTREAQVHELENLQMTESFTLEELINHLYSIDQILTTKLDVLDSEIGNYSDKLKDFNGLIVSSNNNINDKNHQSVEGIFEALKRYKAIIDNVEQNI